MSLLWQGLYAALVTECILVLILCLPLPMIIQRNFGSLLRKIFQIPGFSILVRPCPSAPTCPTVQARIILPTPIELGIGLARIPRSTMTVERCMWMLLFPTAQPVSKRPTQALVPIQTLPVDS